MKGNVVRNRSIQVPLRLNKAENERLTSLVKKSDLPREQVLRNLIMQKEIHTRQPEEYFEVRRLVSNMANNINQIARIANTCGQVEQGQVQVLQQMMKKCWQHIRDL